MVLSLKATLKLVSGGKLPWKVGNGPVITDGLPCEGGIILLNLKRMGG